MTDAMLATEDPLQVLRLVAKDDVTTSSRIADALRDAELRAIETAEPTPGFPELVAQATARGIGLAVVSNSSREAVRRYLDAIGLLPAFATVIGRYQGQPPWLLKPSPHMLDLALREANVPRSKAVLVGDSVTDVLAAKAAGTACIGYRPSAEDLADLVEAGADCTVTSINEITKALLASPTTEDEIT